MPSPLARRATAEPTEQRLVAAARTLLLRDGVAGVTMRKVAALAGVTPTSVYWHFGSREALLGEALTALIDELPQPKVRGRTPRRRIVELATGLREQVAATQPVQELALELGRAAELSFPTQVALAREVAATGLRGDQAAMVVRAILFTVGGFILLTDNFEQRVEGSETTQELWRSQGGGAVEAGLQHAMEQGVDADALFLFTLEHLLDGLLPD
ncbi:MAG TPA: helix-turn-helix domain-containing protein [Acidimicrobiales bacterium]|jgi:AcrR family transcriptional regulator